MKQQLKIGVVGFPIAKERVLAAVDVVEIGDARTIPPKPAKAKKLRKDAPAQVNFVVQASDYLFKNPPDGTTLPGELSQYGGFRLTDENRELWTWCIRYAEALGAPALLLMTPSDFRPSKGNWENFSNFISNVDTGDLKIIWEPRGLWEHDVASKFAMEHGLYLVTDPLRDELPASPFAYFRLGPFAAMGSRVGTYDLERIAQAASSYEEVYCVFDTPRALDDARNLKKIVDELDD